jgi:hypothetical protein
VLVHDLKNLMDGFLLLQSEKYENQIQIYHLTRRFPNCSNYIPLENEILFTNLYLIGAEIVASFGYPKSQNVAKVQLRFFTNIYSSSPPSDEQITLLVDGVVFYSRIFQQVEPNK